MDYALWDIVTTHLETGLDPEGAFILWRAAPWKIITGCVEYPEDVPGYHLFDG